MRCPELERLEKKQIEIRAAQRNPQVSEAQRRILEGKERSIIMDIADHKSFGHDGQPCTGE